MIFNQEYLVFRFSNDEDDDSLQRAQFEHEQKYGWGLKIDFWFDEDDEQQARFYEKGKEVYRNVDYLRHTKYNVEKDLFENIGNGDWEHLHFCHRPKVDHQKYTDHSWQYAGKLGDQKLFQEWQLKKKLQQGNYDVNTLHTIILNLKAFMGDVPILRSELQPMIERLTEIYHLIDQ